MDLVNGRTDGLKSSLKLYHGNELQLAYQQLMAEAPEMSHRVFYPFPSGESTAYPPARLFLLSTN